MTLKTDTRNSLLGTIQVKPLEKHVSRTDRLRSKYINKKAPIFSNTDPVNTAVKMLSLQHSSKNGHTNVYGNQQLCSIPWLS